MSEKTEASSVPALFSNFVMSLASATLVELGLMPDPLSKETRKNLEHAKQNIEILDMLRTKTKGNLSADENRMIERVVTDLKLQFSKSKKS
jgi:hypothetical protein